MKIDEFFAEVALCERDWVGLGLIILRYFQIEPVVFDIRCEVSPDKSANRAALVLVKEQKTFAFSRACSEDRAKSYFSSWTWKEPLAKTDNYLLIL